MNSFEGCELNVIVDNICADSFSSSSSSTAKISSYCMNAITYLKKKCKSTPKVAADLVSLKAVNHFIKLLKNCQEESDSQVRFLRV